MRRIAAIVSIPLLVLIGSAIHAANTNAPFFARQLVYGIPAADKFIHFFLFGALTLVLEVTFGLRTLALRGYQIPLVALVVLVAVTIEELTQAYIPYRTLDFLDWLADAGGISAFAWLARRVPMTADELASPPA